jgi:hypothetical protein
MLSKPRWLLHLEGAATLALSVYLYGTGHSPWRLFALLILAPDLSLLGYWKDGKWGSATYNLVHTLTGPLLLAAIALVFGKPGAFPMH